MTTPIPPGEGLAKLRSSGEVERATALLDDLEPLVLSKGAEAPSSVLARLRADER
jgi:hypothetical protein